MIWGKLYDFQKDAVIGAIRKLEKYNGCIIADSVGLGKTFEALKEENGASFDMSKLFSINQSMLASAF